MLQDECWFLCLSLCEDPVKLENHSSRNRTVLGGMCVWSIMFQEEKRLRFFKVCRVLACRTRPNESRRDPELIFKRGKGKFVHSDVQKFSV